MVETVYLVDSDNINPFHNLALQAHIIENIPDDSLVFLVWRNNDSIILGNKSSPYTECNVSQLEIENTRLCRRDSHGKTVFNDLGTLNYAFFIYMNNYIPSEHINVIYQALTRMQLPVYLENNEIMLNKLRLTDNNDYIKEHRCMYSGSLYWSCDKSKRARLLKDPLNKKGIINIVDYDPFIRYIDVKENILQSLADLYGDVYQMSITDDLLDYLEHYQSYRYVYDADSRYTIRISDNYDFGQAQIYVDLFRNRILKIDVYLPEEDVEVIDLIMNTFNELVLDELQFIQKLRRIDKKYHDDFTKLFEKIKKDSYCL
ncbi:MAG: lipoyl protein ligase domain-containing protein [Erysipelotrichaceae bacterium]|jgi:lipoate-protein ligase A